MEHNKKYIIVGILGFLAVALGAFGAHSLKLDDKTVHAYETAVLYHFFHLFALMFTIYLIDKCGDKLLSVAFNFFLVGIFLFSGSLYAISFLKVWDVKIWLLGPITPVGGLCFMVGWALIVFNFIRKRSQ